MVYCHNIGTSGLENDINATIPTIFGHRGTGGSGPGTFTIHPENSFCSIQAAIEHGADGVELDVWLTKDDEIVVVHGCGADHDGHLFDTLFNHGDSFDSSSRIEEMTLAEVRSRFFLRRPWRGTRADLDDHAAEHFVCDGHTYFNLREPHMCSHGDAFADHSQIPTLRDLFDRFAPTAANLQRESEEGQKLTCAFQVELKGNRPELGAKVLELAKEYPQGTIARISSFMWYPPVADDETPANPSAGEGATRRLGVSRDQFAETVTANGTTCDLLAPLIGNSLGIPLALLFSAPLPPSIGDVVACLQKFEARWLHCKFDFWRFRPETEGLLLNNLSGVSLGELQDMRGTPNDIRVHVAEPIVTEFVRTLGSHGVSVMFYWGGRGRDFASDLSLSLACGVHSLCPNFVDLALESRREHLVQQAASTVAERIKVTPPVVLPASTMAPSSVGEPSSAGVLDEGQSPVPHLRMASIPKQASEAANIMRRVANSVSNNLQEEDKDGSLPKRAKKSFLA